MENPNSKKCIWNIITPMWAKLSIAPVPLPVLICLIKALFVVGRIQKVTLYDANDPNAHVVGLQRKKDS